MPDPRRALQQKLADWQRAGLTHLPHVELPEPVPRTGPTRPPAPDSGLTQRNPPSDQPPPAPIPAARPEPSRPPSPELPVTVSDLPRAQREQQLAALAETVSRCVRCEELERTRTQTVFGVGNPEARVMFVGEAPGADEDKQGEPFVGRAGQLMNRIIEACGWKRGDLYICNILRCRPPGNRNPTSEEAAHCREYLDGQIRIVDPDYIVCWGSVAAQNLLDVTTPIGKLRQKWFKYGRAKVLCTYHPSYLLRNPAAKKPVWEDMKFLLAEMGEEPPVA